MPDDIAIFTIEECSDDFHARFSAKERSYEYIITTQKDPFGKDFSWYLSNPLRVDLMQEAAQKLFDYTDFTSFSKLHTDVNNNNCKIIEASITEKNNKIIFKITADRFLRDMVRAITGTLVDVGRTKISIDDFCKIIESTNRCNAGQSAPADGLFLCDVKY